MQRAPGTVPCGGTRSFPIQGARKMRALPGSVLTPPLPCGEFFWLRLCSTVKIPAPLAIRRGAPVWAPAAGAATQGRPYDCVPVGALPCEANTAWWTSAQEGRARVPPLTGQTGRGIFIGDVETL